MSDQHFQCVQKYFDAMYGSFDPASLDAVLADDVIVRIVYNNDDGTEFDKKSFLTQTQEKHFDTVTSTLVKSYGVTFVEPGVYSIAVNVTLNDNKNLLCVGRMEVGDNQIKNILFSITA